MRSWFFWRPLMSQFLRSLLNDDAGFIFSVELMLVFVILLLGIIAGLTALRSSVVVELYETGQAILALNQTYTISGVTGCCGSSGFSDAEDSAGFKTVVGNILLNAPACVTGTTVDINVVV